MRVAGNTGISVVICCYNSTARLPETLEALAAQVVASTLNWEIVLVDNASTDHTARLATSLWKQLGADVPLRMVYEPNPGLNNARKKGITEAYYSIILFCDDDNRLAPDYVNGIYQIMWAHPEVAACGGQGIPVFETAPPAWFEEYKETFAVGPQDLNEEDGKLLNLYGAGMAVQKQALDHLSSTGYNPFMMGRTGSKLSSAEDTELTYALVLLGYKLHYASSLHFGHFLPAPRLTRQYLHRIFTAFGNDGPVRNLYYSYISDRYFHKKIRNWFFHWLLGFVRLVKYLLIPPKKNGRIIYCKWSLAYLASLWKMRRSYAYMKKNIELLKNAPRPLIPLRNTQKQVTLSSELS